MQAPVGGRSLIAAAITFLWRRGRVGLRGVDPSADHVRQSVNPGAHLLDRLHDVCILVLDLFPGHIAAYALCLVGLDLHSLI